jgi:competence protein ComEC
LALLGCGFLWASVSPACGQAFHGFASSSLTPVKDESDGWGLKIVVFNVGQADAILVLTPNGDTCLIDSGQASSAGNRVADYLEDPARNGVGALSSIDVLYSTHYDADHIGGLPQIRKRGVTIRKAFDQGLAGARAMKTDDDKPTVFAKYVAAVGDPNNDLVKKPEESEFVRHRMTFGGREHLGTDHDVEIRCVGVGGDTAGDEHDLTLDPSDPKFDGNPGSIALLIRFGEFELYTAGDQTDDHWKHEMPAVEDTILDAEAIPGGRDIDVFKVSHHGSDTSNSPRLVEAIDPEVAIISSTHTHHGLPRRITLKTLQDNRCFVLITGDGKNPETDDYAESSETDTDTPENFVVNSAAVFNDQGDVTVMVSRDGSRDTVLGRSFTKTFSAKDADNQR